MSPHQPKVVKVNGLALGPCYRAVCKCGWLGRLYPIQTKGGAKASEMAEADGTKHAMNLETKLATPDFIKHINDQMFTVEEPSWPCR